ncbi:uncharacterized protein LOC141632175 [Silene latifolia]|uniref:uncharacterized protein LOC141632175 n=1 Tax=Silene latifolia TaxID=37657 RepID=UPI003D77034D
MDDNIEPDNDNIDGLMKDLEEDIVECPIIFQRMVDNSKKPLYPNGSKFSLLLAVLKLFTLKAGNGWSDKSFTSLLELLCQMLPEGNELPSTTYECKKLLCPLSTSYQKIHACVKDCILYTKKYSELKECPKCGESRYKMVDNGNGGKKKGSPVKTLWYLPIIPKFKRFFSNKKDAEYMLWHQKGRNKDGRLRHVADSPQWRTIDRTFPEFGSEPRNLRLGLCTDGINPFGTLSTQHSCWPVMLIIYNIPPWLTTKCKYIMLTLLILGPKQPGNDIDVYLAPLIEDLKLLWNDGVEVFDASTSSRFQMHAMLYCTINDFPAYGNLSGYRLKTDKGCPVCGDDTESDWLEHNGKFSYRGGRHFLPENHQYRKKKKHLYVRHSIDVMHVEKNVFNSLIGTLLNMPNKTKDGVKARNDMAARGRIELKPIEKGKRIYIPPSCTTLSKKEKMIVCESLKGVKVPHGYSSNISHLVAIKDSKLVGMKSHDCHVMRTQLLPVAIRSVLPKHVRQVITKLCLFFDAINSKDIHPDTLDDLQADVVVTLCELEMYFPISFFDIMVHLVIHLVREIKLCGPVFQRNMWAMERDMGTYKRRMKNRCHPEGSIVEATIACETIQFCVDYMADVQPIGVPISRHEGRLLGKAYGPKSNITSFEGYDINGFCFYTSRQDEKSTMQNSGVTLLASSEEYVGKGKDPVDITRAYYGKIEDIWELEYVTFSVPLFRCKWVDCDKGVTVDDMGFILVNFNVVGHIHEPFILASQVKQLFYIEDPLDKRSSVVRYGKRRILGVDGVVDEQEYDQLDELPPISVMRRSVQDLRDESYLRQDHDEGLWFDKLK